MNKNNKKINAISNKDTKIIQQTGKLQKSKTQKNKIRINSNNSIKHFPPLTTSDRLYEGKVILFGITGGIAAYKAVSIVSYLRRNGADVYVIMTEHALEFIKPLTLKSLCTHDVLADMFNDKGYITHISLTEIADLFIIAPASANILAKMKNGLADDMLSTMLLAYPGDVLIAPSMNDNMYNHPATQENLHALINRGIKAVLPEYGKLASGKVGKGRFPQEESILFKINELLLVKPYLESIEFGLLDKLTKKYEGKKCIVTLGATREYIDPVRYITNGSSGKMGYAIAAALESLGAFVTVVAGHYTDTRIDKYEPIKVDSTQDMLDAVLSLLNKNDILFMAAAPSDFTPIKKNSEKIKKTDSLEVKFKQNPDILMGLRKKNTSIAVVGFAAETSNEIENGKKKLHKKIMQAICINKVYRDSMGFNQDTNEITIVKENDEIIKIPSMRKEFCAYAILASI